MASIVTLPLIIDNLPVQHAESSIVTNYSCNTKADYVRYVSASSADANAAVESAQIAFKSWSKTMPATRRTILLRTAALVRENAQQFIQIQVSETNCTEVWAGHNVNWAALHLEEMAARITSVLTGDLPVVQTPGQMGMVFKSPLGPVLSIVPWNAAVFLACRAIDTPIAVGCTVVLKASEQSPRTHHYLASLFRQAGLPPGVLNVVHVRREDAAEVTESLISHRYIRKIEFIGSAAIGKHIAALSGKHLKPVMMELGGKAAALVLEDADLEFAAEACTNGGFMHAGQICMSTERIIVKSAIADKFLPLLKKAAANFSPSCSVSTAVSERTIRLLNDAISKGAKLVYGEVKFLEKAQLQPVLLSGVTSEMEMYDEETFGPVIAIYTVPTDEEAIELANSTKYGLSAGVFSKDIGRALDIARQIEAGQIHINWASGTINDEATLPISCTKGSGWGRTNAGYGLEEFLELRTVTITNPEIFAAALRSKVQNGDETGVENGLQNGVQHGAQNGS